MLVSSSSSYRWIASGIALVVFRFIVAKALLVRTTFAKIKDYPGRVMLWISPFGAMGLVVAGTYPRPGMGGYYAAKFSLHEKFGATSFVSVLFSAAKPIFWFADSEAIKIIASDRHTFQKDIVGYEMINMYGGNLVSLEGPDWKRHRSIAMSAFNEANVALVWSESLRVVNEWFEELDAAGPDATVDMLQIMTQATLFVLASAGFGRRMTWSAESTTSPPFGCKLTFRSAVVNSVNNVIFKALTPGWFFRFSSLIKVPYLSSRALLTQLAFDDLRIHMLDLIASSRAEIISGKSSGASGAALLRNLVEANMNQDGSSKKLTDEELLSDVFTFLLAGHETSSHTLCFAFVLLALYPDSQQKLYEEITRVWPADVPLTQLSTNHKKYMDSLEYTTACIRETLRLFPPEPRLGKVVRKDAVLPGTYFTPGSKQSPSVETGKFSMAVPAGSHAVMDIWALHMNSLYWGEDASEFKPEHFIDTETYKWPRNAFLPFSGGARSCIGQRFALVEMVGILASVVRRYRIQVPDDLAERPFEEQKKELLAWTTGITLTPVKPHVKLCRRV